MKKTVPFLLFGNSEDYLTLNIKDLMTIESISGLSIIEIFRAYANGTFTLTSIYQILPVAYADCEAEKEEKLSVVKRIDEAIEDGVSVTDFGMPIMRAIVDTGVFGKKQEQAKKKKAAKTLAE